MTSNNLARRPGRGALSLLAALGAGALIGWTAHRNTALEARWRDLSREVEALAQDPARPPVAGSCTAVVDPRTVAEAVRGALGQVEGSTAAQTTAQAQAKPAQEAAPPSDEALVALQHGQELVARARTKGHWTTEDALALQGMVASADDDDTRMQLRLLVVQALNRQELKLDAPLMF